VRLIGALGLQILLELIDAVLAPIDFAVGNYPGDTKAAQVNRILVSSLQSLGGLCVLTGRLYFRCQGRAQAACKDINGAYVCPFNKQRAARQSWGGADKRSLRLAQFVLADAPLAAVRPHLQRRESPPPLVDEIIRRTYRSLTGLRSTRITR
jgi:hypothetical protein